MVAYTYDAWGKLLSVTGTLASTLGAANPFRYRGYAYDANGNITEITHGAASASYVYDKANQLIRENDGFSGKTWTYSYDRFGNMLEKAEYAYTTGTLGTPVQTIAYTYSTGEWKDLLTGYNGQAITYDAMGNPTSYLGSALSWTDGRKLESFGSTASYVYSREGTRIQKTVGNTVTNYHYNGSLLMAETSGNTSQYYNYDANGNLISLYYNNTYYYYLRNGQGDIVGLLDNTGAPVVAYTYDAWGKALSVTGTLASTLGIANPFRYRGYYYDTETQLYYLQSRYYDPAVCRFLNGDVLMSTGQGIIGCNMFGYCGNNPVKRQDSSGLFWSELLEVGKELSFQIAQSIRALSPAYAGASAAAIADGPLPFGDIALGVLFIATVGVAIYKTTQVRARTKETTKEKVAPLVPFPPDTVIYRYGGTNPGNLVPTQRDVDWGTGLSFSTIYQPGAAMTTIGKVNATGCLLAVRDSATHVTVYPVGGTVKQWRTAGATSIWTIALKAIVVKS